MKRAERVEGPSPVEVLEIGVVALAAVQGVCVGAWLLLTPAWALRAGGFPAAPLFFVRWAGVLYLALVAGSTFDFLRLRRVMLLVLGRAATALFLVTAWAAGGLPPLLVVAVVVEAGLAAAAVAVHPAADRSRRARARLRLVTPAPTEVRPAGRR